MQQEARERIEALRARHRRQPEDDASDDDSDDVEVEYVH
jgi:GTP-binding protein